MQPFKKNVSLVPYNYCCPEISAVENTEFYRKSVPNLEKSEKVLSTVAMQDQSRETRVPRDCPRGHVTRSRGT